MKLFLNHIFKFIFLFSIISLIAYKITTRVKYDNVFSSMEESIKKESDINVVLFGSSIEQHYDKNSDSHFSISEILDTISKKKIRGISHPGFYLPVFASFVDYIKNNNKNRKLEYLIIPLNLRSFSKPWYLSSYNQFRDVDYCLSIKKMMLKEYASSEKNLNIKLACNPNENLDGFLKTFSLSKNDNDFEKCVYYEFNIETENHTLKYLHSILKEEYLDFEILFYFEPLDYQSLTKKQLNYLDQNINFLKNILAKKQIKFIDLSKLLSTDKFDYYNSFNEHTKQIGKFHTANEINKLIN